MTLLDFARGPALEWSLYILVGGSLLRLLGMLLLLRHKDLSAPRSGDTLSGGLRTVFTRLWPHREFMSVMRFPVLIAYTLHIGLAIVVFLFVPHILFIESMTGLSWPGLPNDLIMLTAAITIGALVALWVRRFQVPVLKTISGVGDHVALLITLLPLLTGLASYAHIGLDYPTMLALHLLSVELLFVYFPLGKLFHAVLWVPARFKLGAAFQRRGVRA